MLHLMLLHPKMVGFFAATFAVASVTPPSFEGLDRVPAAQPLDPPTDEDPMAVHKNVA